MKRRYAPRVRKWMQAGFRGAWPSQRVAAGPGGGKAAPRSDVILRVPSRMVAKISVGLPVFNGEAYLARALDSLIAQDFESFELIICDNASTDATESICREF